LLKGGVLVGEYLRQKREDAGLSLKDISEITRIRTEYLKALENEDFSKIPGEVFIKGYIRAYLHALSLDPEEGINLYLEDVRKDLPVEPHIKESKWQQFRSAHLLIAGIIVLITAGAFLYGLFSREKVETLVEPETKPSEVLVQELERPKGLPLPISPVEVAEADYTNKHVLEINTIEETWIYLKIDNDLSYSMLLKPGETKRWTAKEGFFLKIGNAGGINIAFDGQMLGAPGKRGHVVRLRLPEDLKKLQTQPEQKIEGLED
jgi:transcriptional regulator with XRE-family HTH domain